jgi:hypothetical protein
MDNIDTSVSTVAQSNYQKNKDKYTARWDCEICGVSINRNTISNHKKSKKHNDILKILKQNNLLEEKSNKEKLFNNNTIQNNNTKSNDIIVNETIENNIKGDDIKIIPQVKVIENDKQSEQINKLLDQNGVLIEIIKKLMK